MAHDEQAAVSAPAINPGQREQSTRRCSEFSGMILNPDASPITEEQLAAEIRGIYDGLITVETKCIDIGAASIRDETETRLGVEHWQALIALNRTLAYEHHDFPIATQHPSTTDETELDVEQWQALIALHRTLLYEHHDFLMASQHPSAMGETALHIEQWQALIALHRTLLYEHHDFSMAMQQRSATDDFKSRMPARMWKHAIHTFLEVLRHRRPDSQDYMLAFVVLAYQMMALLFETVPCFTDTWIECLGDLARYRMAIEDDREMHAIWGGVAARWYTLASDRRPEIGRLYHHLGILDSQDYMLAFVVFAYQMMALLFETVPCPTDTWIECLGDLARYRMAIEDDHAAHAMWGSVAARWYTMASDRHPDIGRLYHHPGVLERPTVRSRQDLYQRALGGTYGRREEPRDRDPRHPARKNTGLDMSRSSVGVGRSPGSDSSSKEHILCAEPSGLWRSDGNAGRHGGGQDVVLSWTACFFGPSSIGSASRTARGKRRKDATIPIGKPGIDAGRSWCSTGTKVLENARRAFVEATEYFATLCLTAMNSRTWWPLLIFSRLKTVMAYPVADSLTTTQGTNASNFSSWILPLIMLLLALARGCWHIVSPVEKLRASSPKTTYEIVSALSFTVVEAANEHDRGTNWTILGGWLFWSLGNQVRRYKLTRKKYRDRYIPLMLPSGGLLAFLVAATMVRLTGSGSITRQCLDALPLGLSLSAWSLHALWSDPLQEVEDVGRQSRSSGEAAVVELDSFSSRAPQIRSRSLNRGNAVSDPGDPRLEEQRLVHDRGEA